MPREEEWKSFFVVTNPDAPKKDRRAKCNFCGTLILICTSGSLYRHLRLKHASEKALEPIVRRHNRRNSSNSGINDLLCRAIYGGTLPISILRDQLFRQFIDATTSSVNYALPDEQAISGLAGAELTIRMRQAISRDLSTAVGIGLTEDGWSSADMRPFLVITAHWISMNSESTAVMRKAVLALMPLYGSHTADRLREATNEVRKLYGIEHIPTETTTDNASAFCKAFPVKERSIWSSKADDDDDDDYSPDESDDESNCSDLNDDDEERELAELQNESAPSAYVDDSGISPDCAGTAHTVDELENLKSVVEEIVYGVRCSSHTDQLAVADGMAVADESIVDLLDTIYRAVKQTRQSAAMRKRLLDETGFRSIPKKNATRWNYVLRTLRRVQKIGLLVWNRIFTDQMLTDYQWHLLHALIATLQPLADATDRLQGDTYPTLGEVIPFAIELQLEFDDSNWIDNSDSDLLQMSEHRVQLESDLRDMRDKFYRSLQARFDSVVRSRLYWTATALTPHLKLLPAQSDAVPVLIMDIREDVLVHLCDVLKTIEERTSENSPPQVGKPAKKVQKFRFMQSASGSSSSSSRLSLRDKVEKELDKYISEPIVEDVDTLHYWHQVRVSGHFPLLCRAAQAILAIPASEASSERALSKAALQLKRLGFNLSDETLQRRTFLNANKEYFSFSDVKE